MRMPSGEMSRPSSTRRASSWSVTTSPLKAARRWRRRSGPPVCAAAASAASPGARVDGQRTAGAALEGRRERALLRRLQALEAESDDVLRRAGPAALLRRARTLARSQAAASPAELRGELQGEARAERRTAGVASRRAPRRESSIRVAFRRRRPMRQVTSTPTKHARARCAVPRRCRARAAAAGAAPRGAPGAAPGSRSRCGAARRAARSSPPPTTPTFSGPPAVSRRASPRPPRRAARSPRTAAAAASSRAGTAAPRRWREVDAEILEDRADVSELAVVHDQDRRAVGHECRSLALRFGGSRAGL